jgi:cell division protein FtsX
VLRLVGASRRQIRRPVVLLGALGFGAAAAGGCALALIVASIAAPRLGALAPLLAVPWSWPLPAALLAGGIAAGVLAAAAAGAALAAVGAWRAERRIDGP